MNLYMYDSQLQLDNLDRTARLVLTGNEPVDWNTG